MKRLDIELQNIEHPIKWNEIVKLIAEKHTGYLVYMINSIYSEIHLRLFSSENKPEYIMGRVEGWWESSNQDEAKRLAVHWSRVDIITFPAPWASLTKIGRKDAN